MRKTQFLNATERTKWVQNVPQDYRYFHTSGIRENEIEDRDHLDNVKTFSTKLEGCARYLIQWSDI